MNYFLVPFSNNGFFQSFDSLGEVVDKMEEGGATALGPSLCVAIGMCESCPGSEILLCTGSHCVFSF